jgi:hypothetical protein
MLSDKFDHKGGDAKWVNIKIKMPWAWNNAKKEQARNKLTQ